MHTIKSIPESHVVSEFLKAEYFSPRFAEPITSYLNSTGHTEKLILEPDLSDDTENSVRANILNVARGYLDRTPGNIFSRFPHGVEWVRGVLKPEELGAVLLPDHPAWMEISIGTRRVSVGAENLMSSDPSSNPARYVRDFIAEYGSDESYPSIILVGQSLDSQLVILEGSVRCISYWLMREKINQVDVIVGTSVLMSNYDSALTS